jgi:putative transposase
MYSYEDRLRAVRLYIKLGKRIALTVRQLGYPRKERSRPGTVSMSSATTYPPATCARRGPHRRTRNAPSSTTSGTAAASLPRSSRWAIPRGHCWRRGFKSCIRRIARVLSADPRIPEAKQSAIISLCTRSSSAQAVADEVGVSRGSLYKWKNQLLGHDISAPMKRQQDAPASSDRAEWNSSSRHFDETSGACSWRRTC